MKRLPLYVGVILAIDLALLLLCALHLPSLRERASVPFRAGDEDHRIVVTEILQSSACAELQRGDEILTWNNLSIPRSAAMEFLANGSTIGERVSITVRRGEKTLSTQIELIPAHTIQYVFVILFVGLIAWSLAVFVLLARPGDLAANVLHWCLLCLAIVVVIAFEGSTPRSVLGYASSVLFFLSYFGVTTLFLLFTILFPRPRPRHLGLKSFLICGPMLVLTAILIYYHARAVMGMSIDDFDTYRSFFSWFHFLLILYVGAGVVNFVRSYRTATSVDERKKLKWVLWGLCIGPTPFLVLSVVPQLFNSPGLLPEEYTLAFLLMIPVAFAVSIVRYHLLDIEIVIHRTTVYGIVVGALLLVYVVMVSIVAAFVGSYSVQSSALAAVLVALLFEPARVRVQRFVDSRFFRVRYNFRLAERAFVDRIKRCLDIQELANLMVEHTEELIPLKRIGFFVLTQPGNRLRTLAQKNFDLFAHHSVPFEPEKLRTRLQLPVALSDKVEAGVRHEPADERVFRRWGMALVFPMLSEKFEFLGFLVLGEKKSEANFSVEDVDLLTNIATQAGLEIERMTLRQELILKKAEMDRLAELNALKSDFVSYVSHELRTPLTSIKMFAELLLTRRRALDVKSRQYVHTIEGEADRLNRMVSTILNSARIEQGLTEYRFREVDLRQIAGEALRIMKYQLDKQQFRVEFRPNGRRLSIAADPDALLEAMTNLIANSIKYSGERKRITVTMGSRNSWAYYRIADRGYGISPEALPHLFQKFYRDPAHSRRVQGVGLGLPLVKHILDAHGGRVDVRSTVGKGSIFTLWFPPTTRTHETQAEHSRR